MNKAHSPINWQNKPSVNTPINETNLNKMDSTIGILDDRIIAHDTSKLDKSTANTMVKDVTFNESTGIFTITLLNGSTKTLDTKLEKIATNFRYDYSTQKLILTLVDGTTQEIDMSALLTQYEFTDSDTIGWEVAEDGTVKAKVLDGSITEDMLEPNYLANIKVETAKSESYMNSAKTSEINASSSANLAQSYAVGGTGTRDGEDTDNAKYYSENAKPVAQTITGTNPTATNSTNAPLIYGKFGGYTLQDGEPTPDNPIDIQGLGDSGTIEVKTCGKNLLSNNLDKIKELNNMGFWSGNTYKWQGITYTFNDDGTITANGTTSELYNHHVEYELKVRKGIVYSRLFSNNKGSYIHGQEEYVKPIANNRWKCIADGTVFVRCALPHDNGVTYTNEVLYPMVVVGDVTLTEADYEPYTETTATIPIDTLYEGDYLEVYADGSGKLVRVNKELEITSWIDSISNILTNTIEIRSIQLTDRKVAPFKCTTACYVSSTWNVDTPHICSWGGIVADQICVRIPINSSIEDYTCKVVYKLATPTETPLTAEQVQAFKQLYTFDNVTNFFCDGELTARYYCNTDSGDTVGMIQETVDGLQKTVKEIPDTYTTQSDFDRIVGGTVSDSGLTNVSYIVPNEISDGSMSFGSYTSGTLVDALRKATNQITMFLGTLFEEGDKSVVFENDSVAGTLEVFRHKLSEGTYLLDIKVTITSITETLSGNGPSVDLTLQDIGFEDNIIAIRESECLLASYYPLIVNGSSYCLGGGMVSTENSTKGFYLRFLPHKNTKGSISSNNKSVLSGTMMIKVVEQQL